MSEKRKPENIRIGGIQIAIWENTSKKGNTFYSTTIERNYKDGDEWKKTNSLNTNDIPKAILGLQKAYEKIAMKEVETEEE